MNTWYSADTHFWHKLLTRLRGFDDLEAHNETIIGNWNERVRPDDLVWLLGDIGLDSDSGGDSRVLDSAGQLNGRKQLITGNHDSVWPAHRNARKHQRQWLEVFESVQAFARIRLAKRTILLSHFPYLNAGDGTHAGEERATQYRLHDEGLWLLHGHTHAKDQITGLRSLHVGLDAWDLRPVSEKQILDRITEHERGSHMLVA